MRVLGLDLETTGLDPATNRIVELGCVLWNVEEKKPIVTLGVLVWEPDYPLSCPEALKTHGISEEILKEFGAPPKKVFQELEDFIGRHKPDVACGHNGNVFDRPFLLSEIKRLGLAAPHLDALHWIDTKVDIPVKGESTKLKYVAADHGFLNPFAHRALFDVMTMLQVLSTHDLNEIIRTSKIPLVRLEARMVFNDPQFNAKKDLVKKQKFMWDADKKIWWKQVREPEVTAELLAVPFAQIKC